MLKKVKSTFKCLIVLKSFFIICKVPNLQKVQFKKKMPFNLHEPLTFK